MLRSVVILIRGVVCGHPSVPYHNLFRNRGGFPTKSAENQLTYRPNTPGFKRHGGGKICGKSLSGDTAQAANCPILTQLLAEKRWVII